MNVPARPSSDAPLWAELSATDKRSRALVVADELFSQQGLGVPMPVVAEAVGVGVGSLYRQIGKKEDLIAALVIVRFERILALIDTDPADTLDPWSAFCGSVHSVINLCVSDHLSQEAWIMSSSREDVLQARARLVAAVERLVERAHAGGEISPSATALDVRLLFKAATAAETLSPGGAARLTELALRGLRSDAPAVTAGASRVDA